MYKHKKASKLGRAKSVWLKKALLFLQFSVSFFEIIVLKNSRNKIIYKNKFTSSKMFTLHLCTYKVYISSIY